MLDLTEHKTNKETGRRIQFLPLKTINVKTKRRFLLCSVRRAHWRFNLFCLRLGENSATVPEKLLF